MKTRNLIILALLMSGGQALAGNSGHRLEVRTGERIRFPVEMVENGKSYQLSWSMVARPEGSLEELNLASGTPGLSDNPYSPGVQPGDLELIPDLPGEYLILVEILPEATGSPSSNDETAVETYVVTAEGEPAIGGCSTSSSPAKSLMLFGLVIAVLLVSRCKHLLQNSQDLA